MDTKDLSQSAHNNWDDEETQGGYHCPVLMDGHIKERQEDLSRGITEDELYQVGHFRAARSPQSHIGPFKWAIDFLVPDGTPVFSALGGIVFEAEEQCEKWGG